MSASKPGLALACILGVLLGGGTAQAASRVINAAERTEVAAPREADAKLEAVVMTANNRDTNLRKTATSILLLGMDTTRALQKRR